MQFSGVKLPHLAGFVFSRNRGVWQLSETVVPSDMQLESQNGQEIKRLKCDLSDESMVSAKSYLAEPHFPPSIWYD